MKKSLFALAFVAGAIALIGTGCTSTATVTNRFGQQIDLKVQEVTFAPQITVGEKYVTGKSSTTVYWGIFRVGDLSKQATGVNFEQGKSFWGRSGDAFQRAAIYDACAKNNADILIAPQYTTTSSGNFFEKNVTCTVKGFPGYIKGMKIVEPATEKTPATK